MDSFIAKQTNKVLSTPQAYDVWLKVNEVAHEKIVGLLRGENTYTYIAGSDVKLDTLPLDQPGARVDRRQAAGRSQRAASRPR